MSKITVSETVSRSIAVDNSIADVQIAIIRCFQFLEEGRFKEASVIIEQVLNIDPNNTDAHVANFLYHFELTSAEDVVKTFGRCVTYENSVFYKRVKKCAQTELSKKLDFCLGQASEQLEKFNAEEKRRKKEEEEKQREKQRQIKEKLQRELEKQREKERIETKVCMVIGLTVIVLTIVVVLVFSFSHGKL